MAQWRVGSATALATFERMKRIVGSLCCTLFFCEVATAQTCITGAVTTAENKALELVSIAIFKDSGFIAGAVSDKAGRFCLPSTLLLQTGYTLRLSLIGYQSLCRDFVYPDTAFLSNLVLRESEQRLKGLVITGQRALVTRAVDRYIVNVEGSYLAEGKSGLEVLRQSPGLWVDGNGSIRIKGSQQVTVMIDNVVQRMGGTELAEYLSALKSEDISKIEIIPAPPGEYEASAGGIVHVVLKKNRQQGLTGAVFAQYRQQGSKPYVGGGGSLDFKRNRLYVSGSLSFVRDKSTYTGYTHVVYPDGSIFHSPSERVNNNTRSQYRAGASYDLSPAQTITLQSTGSTGALLQYFSSAIYYRKQAGVVTGNAQTDWIRYPLLSGTTLNYSWKIDSIGSFLKLIADYTGSSKKETNTLLSNYNDTTENSHNRTATPSGTTIYSLQADYSWGRRRGTVFKTGVKYVATLRHNKVIGDDYQGGRWMADTGRSNNFLYKERLLMGYLSFEKMMRSTGIKMSLRGEQTDALGRSLTSNESITNRYFSLFPSLFINHVVNEEKENTVSFTYARRVTRPGYNDLNPYRLQLHDYTVLTGNPNLLPQFTHSLEAGYSLRHTYTATVYFQSAHNFIAQTASTVDSAVIEYRSKNFKRSKEYGMTFNASNKVGKLWRITTNLLLYRVRSELMPTLMQTSFSIKSIHTITVEKIVDVDLYAEYDSPYLDANARRTSLFDLDIGAVRKMGPHKLRLSLTDVFDSVHEKDITRYNHTRIDFYQKRPTRTLNLSFTYNFKRGKTFTQKKAEAANSEEKARLGN